MRLVIVTGLSGSGKSIALNALEDEGFYCIDNMPVFLLIAFAQNLIENPDDSFRLTAIGIDARSGHDDLHELPEIVRKLRNADIHCEIVMLEAHDEVLFKRFSETRRKHPLSNKSVSLAGAIRKERQLLEPLLMASDLKIDTTHSNVHQLRDTIRSRVARSGDTSLSLQIESFGFKHGVPCDSDFVFDVRCLPNPHWQQELRPLTGKDQAVADFLEAQPDSIRMFNDIRDFVMNWIPSFRADGRSYLTVSIGCTGGQHRSVYLTEKLCDYFEQQQIPTIRNHRELT
ncbi:MAG: RNase adapter RapZ [Chromatiales bacterium]|jgi:UPF0042 nucleotide-binding protein